MRFMIAYYVNKKIKDLAFFLHQSVTNLSLVSAKSKTFIFLFATNSNFCSFKLERPNYRTLPVLMPLGLKALKYFLRLLDNLVSTILIMIFYFSSLLQLLPCSVKRYKSVSTKINQIKDSQ